MVIAGLETVTRQGSMALLVDGDVRAATGDAARTHGERLPLEFTSFLASTGRTPADVDLFAVVCGPGSFTGLRIGIAAVQGLAFATHRRTVGVPTLEALAFAWRQAHPNDDRLVVACLDGQRGDVFFAAWHFEAGRLEPATATPAILPSVGRPEEAAAQVAAIAVRAAVIVGDGARRYEAAFAHVRSAVVVDAPISLAEAAVRLAALHPNRATTPHALAPIYIRRPDAVLARERAEREAADSAWTGFVVRRITGTEDLAAVAALQRETFTNAWGVDAIKWELDNTDVARLYVMEAPGAGVVAFCACWIVFDELHINSLAVAPAWRRKGVARRLLLQVLREAQQAGARAATLEVRASNLAARRLYEGLGFRVEATRRDYYQAPREDALLLWNRHLT